MDYIPYNKPWESEFHNTISQEDKEQNITFNQLKLEVHDTYRKDEKVTTKFEAVNDEDIVNKIYLDEKIFKKRWSIINIRKRLQRV